MQRAVALLAVAHFTACGASQSAPDGSAVPGPDATTYTDGCGCIAPDATAPGLDASLPDLDARAPGPDASNPVAVLGKISVQDLHDVVGSDGGKDFLLINVHVPYEGNIPGTDKSLPYTNVDAIAAYLGPDLDTRAVVYCMSNYMSGIAGNGLVAKGYRAIRLVDGGMGAWTAAGFTLDK